MYDIAGVFDSIRAKLETIGKYYKTLLFERGSLDQEHFVNELLLKNNLRGVGKDEDFIKKAVKKFLMFKKNKRPYIPKWKCKYCVFSVVDRIVYVDQEVKLKEDEIILRINAACENLKWNIGCSDFITAVLSP